MNSSPQLMQANGIDPALFPRLKTALSGFMASTVRPINDIDKVYWNNKIRRNDLYYRGMQYLTYGYNSSGIADYVNVGSNQSMGIRSNTDNQDSLYDYVLNFLQGDVDTFVAVLGARSPNCQAQAKDASSDDHVRMKMKADRVAQWLHSSWNVELLHPLLVRGLALFGTMFSYTRYSVNPRKYGTTDLQGYNVEHIPTGPAYYQCWNCGTETPMDQAGALIGQTPGLPPNTAPCSKCGTPLGPESLIQPGTIPSLVPAQVASLDNGAVELSIYNSSHITTNLMAKDLDNVPWLMCESEEDKGALVQAYPELRAKIYESYEVGKDERVAMGSYTRALLASPTATVIEQNRNRWLNTLLWISPVAYEYLPNDRSGELRDLMLKQFPEGVKVPMVNGDTLVNRMEDERLTSVWASCKPKPSESIYADAYFDCMIQIQDGINDADNMANEQMERSNPFVICDPEILNPDMLREYSNVPGEFKFAKPGSVGTLDKGFFRVPAAEVNPVLMNYISQKLAWGREITGIVPAIFGGSGDGGEKTAREVEIQRNQAMQKLGTPWNQIRMFWAATYENGVYQAAKYSGTSLFQKNPRGKVESMDMDGIWELLQGGWFMYCEESTPMTVGQRRDAIMHLATGTSPEFQAGMGLKDPNNVTKIQEAWGIPDWKIPGYDEFNALHDIINQLIKGQPMPGQPGPPDPMTGMPGPPGPPEPSIPFDSFLFEPDFAIQVIKGWLLSDRGQQMALENVGGYQNVVAYGHSIASQIAPPKPEMKGPSMSVAVNFGDLTPDMQQATAKTFGIEAPPGLLSLPKPSPKPLGAPGDGPPEGAPPPADGAGPDNPLVNAPPGGLDQPPGNGMPPMQSELAGAPN